MKTPIENIQELLTEYEEGLQGIIVYDIESLEKLQSLTAILHRINTDFREEEKQQIIYAWKDGCYNEKRGHPKSGESYYENKFKNE